MLLLALDTATPQPAVACLRDGAVLSRARVRAAHRVGEDLLGTVAGVLAGAGVAAGELDAVAAGRGPGPFTALRAGLVAAAALAHALGIPAYAFSSLDLLARAAHPATSGAPFAVVTDARRREVYWRCYDRLAAPLGPAQVGPWESAAEDFASRDVRQAFGPAQLPVPNGVRIGLDELVQLWPDAGQAWALVADRLATRAPGERLAPDYLRAPDARVPGPAKPVTSPARGAARNRGPDGRRVRGRADEVSAAAAAERAPGWGR